MLEILSKQFMFGPWKPWLAWWGIWEVNIMFWNASQETKESQWSSDGIEHPPENNDMYFFVELWTLKKKKHKNKNKIESQETKLYWICESQSGWLSETTF